MRKIVVYIATSADGFIARPDGSVDWLNRPQTAGDYGMGGIPPIYRFDRAWAKGFRRTYRQR